MLWLDFWLMLALGAWTAGLTGYLIFGPLSYRHQQDHERTEGIGGHAFAWPFFVWLTVGGYRVHRDRNLDALATPARIMLWLMVVGGIIALWLLAMR